MKQRLTSLLLLISIVALILLVSLLLFPSTTQAQNCPGNVLLSTYHSNGERATYDVFTSGTRAYVACRSTSDLGCLDIVDISNPESPVLLGSSTPDNLQGPPSGIYVTNDKAYVMGDMLVIIDISNPANPTPVGSYTPGGASVYVSGTVAYLGTNEGFQIVDVSNPNNPTLLGVYDVNEFGSIIDLSVSGNTAYLVCDGDAGGLLIFDVASPQTPLLLGTYPIAAATDFSVSGGMAYVISEAGNRDYEGKLFILNISDPVNPILSGNMFITPIPTDIYVSGNIAYVTCEGYFGFSMIRLIDVSDPANPKKSGGYEVEQANFSAISVSNNIAYVAGGENSTNLFILDSNNPATLISTFLWDETVPAAVHVSSNSAYVVGIGPEGYGRLEIVDISNPRMPVQLGHSILDISLSPINVSVSNNIAYVTGGGGLVTVDVTNPTNPTVLGSYTGGAHSGSVVGGIAYLITDNGFQIVDVSDPSNPTLLGESDLSPYSGISDIFVSGTTAYIISNNDPESGGLLMVDVTDPHSPQLLGVQNIGGALRVYVSNNVACVISEGPLWGYSKLWLVNIADPTNPTLFESLNVQGETTDIFAQGNRIYLISRPLLIGSLVQIIDITNPSYPIRLGNFEKERNESSAIFISSGIAYITGENTRNLTLVDVGTGCHQTNPTATIKGKVRVGLENLANVRVKLLDKYMQPLSDTLTDHSGSFSFQNLSPNSYAVMIVEPLGYSSDSTTRFRDLLPGDTLSTNFELTQSILQNVARSKGYWKHQFDVYAKHKGKAQESAEQLLGYITTVQGKYTPHFNFFERATSLQEWQELLSKTKHASMRDKATEELATLVLNLASLNIGQYTVVTSDNHTAGDVLTHVSLVLSNPNAIKDQLELAKDLAEKVNKRELINAGLINDGNILYKINGQKIFWEFGIPFGIPKEYMLYQNYPNPFNPTTIIQYDLPIEGYVHLSVFDVLGREVAILVNERQQAGKGSVMFQAEQLPSGVYYYRLQAGDYNQTKKLLLLR